MTMSKDVVLHGSKIDWIITEKLEKLREIMDEDATFINLPPLGSETTVITVSGTTLPLIERSIRRMNKLVYSHSLVLIKRRFRTIFNSHISFFRIPVRRSAHPSHCRNLLGLRELRLILRATVSR